jgi:hypothetical protein
MLPAASGKEGRKPKSSMPGFDQWSRAGIQSEARKTFDDEKNSARAEDQRRRHAGRMCRSQPPMIIT